MKLGVTHMWGDSLKKFVTEIQLSEQLGYEIITVGDSPAGWRDLYVSLSIMCIESKRATIAPCVTSPFLRHPLVVVNALTTLQELSGGRIALGLATGGSNVFAIGHSPATQNEIKEYWDALVNLMDGKSINWEGREVSPLHYHCKTPVYYSALGPKSLKLAGERANGVIMFTDGDLEDTAKKISQVRSSALNIGRDPNEIDIWVKAFCSIGETRERALDDIKPYLATNALAILKSPDRLVSVSEDIKQKLVQFRARYNVAEHVLQGGSNDRLLDEFGYEFIDYLSKMHTVAGTPLQVKSFLNGLDELGVTAFITSTSGHADSFGHLRSLANLMKS